MAKSCGKSLGPVLESQSYSEVINDTTQFVSALEVNQPLQTQFISILRGPNRRKLLKLIQELQALQEMLVCWSSRKEHSDASFTGLLSHLSTNPSLALDQVKALIIATKAFRELPEVSTERILKLTAEEKSNLFILFKKIPFFSVAHGFPEPALPESDPVYTELLSKIGFTNWRGHLLYEKQISPSGLDLVTLTIIAIHSITTTDLITL